MIVRWFVLLLIDEWLFSGVLFSEWDFHVFLSDLVFSMVGQELVLRLVGLGVDWCVGVVCIPCIRCLFYEVLRDRNVRATVYVTLDRRIFVADDTKVHLDFAIFLCIKRHLFVVVNHTVKGFFRLPLPEYWILRRHDAAFAWSSSCVLFESVFGQSRLFLDTRRPLRTLILSARRFNLCWDNLWLPWSDFSIHSNCRWPRDVFPLLTTTVTSLARCCLFREAALNEIALVAWKHSVTILKDGRSELILGILCLRDLLEL